ncbi:MAG: hypothetical protein F6K26_55370 [Moorea sp. SIO2I5]|nr:hypothetical protein [Moorena sp. SIO2I5]
MTENIPPTPENEGRQPKKSKLLLIGTPKQVRDTINALYSLKYAYPYEWSTPEPTEKPGEVMTTLVRYFYLD